MTADAVVDAMTSAAILAGWWPVSAETSDRLVTVTVRPAVEAIVVDAVEEP